jgi:hypothetical protein
LKEEVLKIRSKGKKVKAKTDPKKDKIKEDAGEDEEVEESKDEDASNLIDFGEEEEVKHQKKEQNIGQSATAFSNLLDDEEEVRQSSDPLDHFAEEVKEEKNDGGDLIDMYAPNDGAGLVDLSDAFSGNSPMSAPKQEQPKPQLNLSQTPNLDPQSFQSKWVGLAAFPVIQRKSNLSLCPNVQSLVNSLASQNIF